MDPESRLSNPIHKASQHMYTLHSLMLTRIPIVRSQRKLFDYRIPKNLSIELRYFRQVVQKVTWNTVENCMIWPVHIWTDGEDSDERAEPKYVWKRILDLDKKGDYFDVVIEWEDGSVTPHSLIQFAQDSPDGLRNFLSTTERSA